MATLSPQQLAQLAYNAGFRGRDLLTAVAVAMAESGGNPNAYNAELAAGTKSGSGSRGLWQIYGTAHPWANNPNAFDPQFNANAAFRVYREAGNSFRPWSTYTNGMASNAARTLNISVPNKSVALSPSLRSNLQAVQVAAMGGTLNRALETGSAPSIAQSSTVNPALLGMLAGTGFMGTGREVADYLAAMGGVILIIIGLLMLFFANKDVALSGVVKTAVKAAI